MIHHCFLIVLQLRWGDGWMRSSVLPSLTLDCSLDIFDQLRGLGMLHRCSFEHESHFVLDDLIEHMKTVQIGTHVIRSNLGFSPMNRAAPLLTLLSAICDDLSSSIGYGYF